MEFCKDCGKKVADGANFCPNCGAPFSSCSSDHIVRQKQMYEGKIIKCPNCGEILRAFTAICPACGFELRGTKSISSVRELASKLEAIESKREPIKSTTIFGQIYGKSITKTDEQKISLIRSFSIPNTKEDLYEFLILAESSIDFAAYDISRPQMDARVAVSDAWVAKVEQAYQKAKLTFGEGPDLETIQKIYDKTHKRITREKWKTFRVLGCFIGIMVLLWTIIIVSFSISESKAEKEEQERLEAIIKEINIALENREYKLALMNAETLEYRKYDSEQERQWNIKREYLIDKIIEAAAENGVQLEYIPESEEEN